MTFPRYYKLADGYHSLETPGVRKFQPSKPIGVTVHYTASGSMKSALNEEGPYGYHIIIDRDGYAIQTCYLDLMVWHAGKSIWNGHSCNESHIAIALVSWGHLDKDGRTWAKTDVPEREIRSRDGILWHVATPQQEIALCKALMWFESIGLDKKNFCGHDECCIPKGRKLDPGGVLGFKMSDIREGKMI